MKVRDLINLLETYDEDEEIYIYRINDPYAETAKNLMLRRIYDVEYIKKGKTYETVSIEKIMLV